MGRVENGFDNKQTNDQHTHQPHGNFLLAIILASLPILSLHWDLYKLIFITSLLQQLPVASSTPPKLSTMFYRALGGPASADLPSPISSHSSPWLPSSNPKAVF